MSFHPSSAKPHQHVHLSRPLTTQVKCFYGSGLLLDTPPRFNSARGSLKSQIRQYCSFLHTINIAGKTRRYRLCLIATLWSFFISSHSKPLPSSSHPWYVTCAVDVWSFIFRITDNVLAGRRRTCIIIKPCVSCLCFSPWHVFKCEPI